MKNDFEFIHEKIKIKILILFIVRRLPEPVVFDMLTEAVVCNEAISYFDFAECVADLVSTGHLQLKDGLYSVTVKGRRNGEITENNLSYTLRKLAEESASAICKKLSRDSMIRTSCTPNSDGGCTVALALSDGVGDIISMEMFAADERYGQKLERGFRKNAEGIYNAMLEMLLDN